MEEPQESAEQRFGWKIDLMSMFQGGVIVLVLNPKQARTAEDAGARGVIPTDKTPAAQEDSEGVAHTTDIGTIKDVMDRVVIPVIGRVRVGHTMEAKAMEEAKVTCIDENEFINPIVDNYKQEYPRHFAFKDGPDGADGYLHELHAAYIYKQPFKVPFICGAEDLGEALKQIQAGASMIRTKISADEELHGVDKTFSCVRKIMDEIEVLSQGDEVMLLSRAGQIGVSFSLVKMVAQLKRLPVPFFAAGGIMMPIDAAMLISMGCDGVIVSSRAFKALNPKTRISDIVTAVKHYRDPVVLARISRRTGGYGPHS